MDNSGPAFPIKQPMSNDIQGMSLRDYFAAQSINAAILKMIHNLRIDHGHDFPIHWEEVAESAYASADAMLEEREK